MSQLVPLDHAEADSGEVALRTYRAVIPALAGYDPTEDSIPATPPIPRLPTGIHRLAIWITSDSPLANPDANHAGSLMTPPVLPGQSGLHLSVQTDKMMPLDLNVVAAYLRQMGWDARVAMLGGIVSRQPLPRHCTDHANRSIHDRPCLADSEAAMNVNSDTLLLDRGAFVGAQNWYHLFVPDYRGYVPCDLVPASGAVRSSAASPHRWPLFERLRNLALHSTACYAGAQRDFVSFRLDLQSTIDAQLDKSYQEDKTRVPLSTSATSSYVAMAYTWMQVLDTAEQNQAWLACMKAMKPPDKLAAPAWTWSVMRLYQTTVENQVFVEDLMRNTIRSVYIAPAVPPTLFAAIYRLEQTGLHASYHLSPFAGATHLHPSQQWFLKLIPTTTLWHVVPLTHAVFADRYQLDAVPANASFARKASRAMTRGDADLEAPGFASQARQNWLFLMTQPEGYQSRHTRDGTIAEPWITLPWHIRYPPALPSPRLPVTEKATAMRDHHTLPPLWSMLTLEASSSLACHWSMSYVGHIPALRSVLEEELAKEPALGSRAVFLMDDRLWPLFDPHQLAEPHVCPDERLQPIISLPAWNVTPMTISVPYADMADDRIVVSGNLLAVALCLLVVVCFTWRSSDISPRRSSHKVS
ncbi:hypothetical protein CAUPRSCDRAFT_10215 [Caulochytrium protostelioides]|uniref:Protein PBN1 n=1 Tax=Caulochytrium protostelioides TaxID=1555241 RepID=A0A4P9WXF6_9FUNG|nr:hypothetical protein CAUPRSCDRAFT_10215 [Caulochytrium protostelioides]